MKTKTATKKEISKNVKNENLENATKEILKNKISVTSEKSFLYKFQIEEKDLTDKQKKSKRVKLRKQLKNLVDKIIITKDKEKQKENIKNFIDFYKFNYILNDFSIESLTHKTNELDLQDYTIVLNLCKESLKK